jgi:hypothetical protein
MRESEVERYLIKRVKEVGGHQRKFISPGCRGVPDRIVVLDCEVYFVELKAPGKKLRPDQEREHLKIRNAGGNTRVIDSKEAVDAFIRQRRTTCL